MSNDNRIKTKLIALLRDAAEIEQQYRWRLSGEKSDSFDGWDGDLLTGYMRGTLSIPFVPDKGSFLESR